MAKVIKYEDLGQQDRRIQYIGKQTAEDLRENAWFFCVSVIAMKGEEVAKEFSGGFNLSQIDCRLVSDKGDGVDVFIGAQADRVIIEPVSTRGSFAFSYPTHVLCEEDYYD